MLHPDSKFNILWETFILLLTILVGIQAPIVIVFNIEPKGLLYFFDTFITTCFALDIIINFFTKIEEKNRLIEERKEVALRYMRGWFWIDLVATVPFDLLSANLRVVSLMKIFRLLRLARLFRLIRIAQTMRRVNSSNVFNPSILRLAFMIFWIAFSAHFIAIGWIFLAGNPDNLDNTTRYIQALYWSVTTLTTIGYGDITPSANKQIIYVIFIEILGAGMYGFIIGNIANLIANIDTAKTQYRERLEKINTFMKYRTIPGELQKRINDYYNYLWDSRRGYDERSVLRDLPVSLKTQVSLFLNQDIIAKVPIFKGASHAFIKEIILNLEPAVFTPGDIVVAKGDLGFDMFFISKGSVDVVSEDETIVYATLTAGHFFGEIALLFSSERTATIKAKEYCDMFRLKKEVFDSVLGRFPEFEVQIKELAAKRKAEIQGDVESDSDNNLHQKEETLENPLISDLTAVFENEEVKLMWKKNDVQCHYEVIRKQDDKKWHMLDSSIMKSEYIDSSPIIGEYNIYKVRAVNMSGPGTWSHSIKILAK